MQDTEGDIPRGHAEVWWGKGHPFEEYFLEFPVFVFGFYKSLRNQIIQILGHQQRGGWSSNGIHSEDQTSAGRILEVRNWKSDAQKVEHAE